MDKLSKPPLNLVTLRVEFPHNLKVSEHRSEYYEKIKTDFPQVIFPEKQSLTYDFSDCHFRNSESTTQIRIATNYFVVETVKYDKVDNFWVLFDKVFSQFKTCFNIENVTTLRLSYDNFIKIEKGISSANFSDYFSLGVSFREQKERKFLTLNGSVFFAIENGILQISINPKQNQETLIWDALEFKIDCQMNKNVNLDGTLGTLKTEFDIAHRNIEDMFVSSLAEQYFQSIK